MKVTRDIISIAQSMRLSMLSPFISFKFCLENKALYSSVFKDHGSGFQAQFERWPGYSGVIRVAGSEPRSSFSISILCKELKFFYLWGEMAIPLQGKWLSKVLDFNSHSEISPSPFPNTSHHHNGTK